MKKIILLGLGILANSFLVAQNYYGSEFIGENGRSYPLGFSKTSNKILMYGYIGGDLTGNFPITFAGGFFDGVVTSIDPTTGTIQWIKGFGGGGNEIVQGAVMDNAGNYYVTGYMETSGAISLDADPGPAVYPLPVESSRGNRDIFLVKLDNNGNFVWAKKNVFPRSFYRQR